MLNSYIGRMVAIYAVAAALAVVALSTYLDDWFDRQLVDATTEIYPCALCPYEALYQKEGIDALTEHLDMRTQDSGLRFRLMRDGHTIAGDLPSEPLPDHAATYLEQISLGSDLVLVVEQYLRVVPDLHPSSDIEQMVLRENLQGLSDQLWLWGAVLVLIGFAATGFIAFKVHRKLTSINQTADHIISGHDLSARIPLSNGRNEFDRLAGNLNHMLDTVEARMEDMRQLSNNIAHDLRTPLTRLRGQLDHIQANGSGYENATKQIDQILTTFDALLRISHLEAGTANISRQQVDVRVLTADIVDLYTPLADQKQQQLSTQVSAGQIVADKDLLFQALANLTENAVKYAPEGSNIQISAQKQESSISLSVIDEGEGVAREMLEKATERFVRADPARQEAGVGLGLALVRAIAEAHDGKLVLMNHADGFEARLNVPLPG